MYRVFADTNVIHRTGTDVVVYGTRLTLEENKAGSFEFSIAPTNPYYSSFSIRTTIVRVFEDHEQIFRGRVMSVTLDTYKVKTVYCEGELSFFSDTIYRPFGYAGSVQNFVRLLIENHNAQVDESRQFTLGKVSGGFDSNDYITRSSETALTTWNIMQTRLLDLLGGYIRIRFEGGNRYFDCLTLEDYREVSDQQIRFGENLVSIEQFLDATDVITCLIPYGARLASDDENNEEQPTNGSTYSGNRVTIDNSGLDYVQSEIGVALFGQVWGINTWDDVTQADNLLSKAQEYVDAVASAAAELTLSAVDLHQLNVDINQISVGSYVQTISKPHGVNRHMLCSKKTIRIEQPEDMEITLGTTVQTLTDRLDSVRTNLSSSRGGAV